jgi:uroporphyrinogen-III synthase
MSRPLEGRVVALAEGRQLEELARLLEAEGAVPLRCPLLSILDVTDPEPVLAWLGDLHAGRFDWLVLMTGEAVRRLLGFAERAGMRDAYVAALGRTPNVTRGPKPGQALKELGLTPTKVAAKPTTSGVIDALRELDLKGKTVGVTLFGKPNPELEQFLTIAGATPRTVMPYVLAPASDDERVVDLIQRLDRGEVASIVFTSSPQLERLIDVAEQRGLGDVLKRGWTRTKVAAVGPVVAETLQAHGVAADVCPEQGFQMKNLVRQMVRALA